MPLRTSRPLPKYYEREINFLKKVFFGVKYLQMIVDLTSQILAEKENKTLNKPFRTPGGPKKFSVYVKNEKGNVVKVNFGDPNMEIKRDDPDRRRSFRARHNCSDPGPKTKARYWSCKMWEAKKSVTDYTKGEWNGNDLFNHNDLLTINPSLAFTDEEDTEIDDSCGCGGCGCESQAAHDMSKYSFNNPGEAMKMARKLGFDKVHTHKQRDDTVFMPGPSHEALMKKLKQSKAKDEEIDMIEAQVAKSIDQLMELQIMMRDMPQDTDFEGWVQSKITKISDYVNSVHGYLKYYDSSNGSFYEMSEEEYKEVTTIEDVFAARPGPKSAAQTPSKPSERKKGSSKNKPGSAGSKGGKITFSEKVLTSLKEKVKNHNSKNKKKITLGQLKKVYRRGAGAFSQSHRPGMTRGGWAMARVNMFLKMKRGGKVKDSYRKADGDI